MQGKNKALCKKTLTGFLIMMLLCVSMVSSVFASYDGKLARKVNNKYSVSRYWIYNISFDRNQGKVVKPISGAEMDSVTAVIDKDLKLPKSTFSAEGYDFLGWNTKEDGTGSYISSAVISDFTDAGKKIIKDQATVRNLTETVNGSVTLYAQWKQKAYTAHFDPNEEYYGVQFNGSMTDQQIEFDVATKLEKIGYSYPYDGAEFVRWTTKPDGTGSAYTDEQLVTNLVPAGTTEITLYAQWKNIPEHFEEGYYNVNVKAQDGRESSYEYEDEEDPASDLSDAYHDHMTGEGINGTAFITQGTHIKTEKTSGRYEKYYSIINNDGKFTEEYKD